METHLEYFLQAFTSLRNDFVPQNLALIEKSDIFGDHFRVVGEAMNVLHAFTKNHVTKVTMS